MENLFRKFAKRVSSIAGNAWTFVLAVLIILTWALSGQYFDYSNTWQLVINTTTTIVTFLMVFLIQNTQNRDNKAINIKLDELIKSLAKANNELIDLEELSDDQLEALEARFKELAHRRSHRS